MAYRDAELDAVPGFTWVFNLHQFSRTKKLIHGQRPINCATLKKIAQKPKYRQHHRNSHAPLALPCFAGNFSHLFCGSSSGSRRHSTQARKGPEFKQWKCTPTQESHKFHQSTTERTGCGLSLESLPRSSKPRGIGAKTATHGISSSGKLTPSLFL